MTPHKKEVLRGLIPSLILPLVFMVIFIKIQDFGEASLKEVIAGMFKADYIAALLAVGAMPNLILFLYAMKKEKWALGRGVIAATMFYGIAVMIMKLH